LAVGRSSSDVGRSLLYSGEPALIEFIRATIVARGPMPFAWFMEQALYHPHNGYYSSGRAAIGRHGDYFTSISVGPLFGRLMAVQFEEMWRLLGMPARFTIVEQGAHDGAFARDVLDAAREHAPQFFGAVRYRIVEPFECLERKQRQTLGCFADTTAWSRSIEELEPFTGVHFSNELLDSMPVHLVTAASSTARTWHEKYVDIDNDGFSFVTGPLSTPALAARATKMPLLDVGYETEVHIAALDWMEQVSRKLQRGFVLAVDYGYARDQFYDLGRRQGTLSCYSKHRRIASPLENVGHTDITAHVEWTAVVEPAEADGLKLVGFVDQHHFITALATGPLRDAFDGERASPQTRRALQTLLHPGLLGMKFQFLGLGRNLPEDATLAGFKFSRNPRAALGLCHAETENVSAGRDGLQLM
jgi:SAM-dependent MidA family methyltransferase